MSESQEIGARIAAQLDRASGLRSAARSDPKAVAARQSLRAWQARRLARTHADLLTDPRFAEAAVFFLTDVYGANDPAARDAEVRQVLPAMVKLLPVSGLAIVADAIELDALSEDLDAAMVAALGRRVSGFDAADYGRAYRKVGRRPDRERQIELVRQLGRSLGHFARRPLVSATLAMMRKPAQLAGLGDLQSFLERGYAAFRKTGGADEFVDLVVAREQQLLEALFVGDDTLLGE
jgi:hypothetical protein